MEIKENDKVRYETAEELRNRIEASVSPFHTVLYVMKELDESDFCRLELGKRWELQKGKKYYVNVYDSTVVAFNVGKEWKGGNLRFAAAHSDFPCLKIKPNCQMKSDGYIKMNVEVYGGAILNTWLDRPLSAAGRVVVKTNNIMKPQIKFIDLIEPLFIIPNLAIHMNREVNKGVELNRQKDLLPVMAVSDGLEENGNDDLLMKCLADKIGVAREDILDYDMFLYPVEAPCTLGINGELFSAGRLDNLTSVQACIKGIKHCMVEDGLNMSVIYDSEEVGSGTKQGAGSAVTRSIIERIFKNFGYDSEMAECALANGMGLSVDVAHAIHPNAPEKNDPTNKLFLNHGFGIKTSSSERYASDPVVIGVIKGLCEKYEIKCQRFVNRSDMPGGSTLGAIAVSNIPMRMLDIGVPILAMHSSRETMGIYDQIYLEKILEEFFCYFTK